MKVKAFLALFAYLLLFSSAQRFTGGQLVDLTTGMARVYPNNDEQFQTFTIYLEQTWERGYRLSTLDQEFFIATGNDCQIHSFEGYWNLGYRCKLRLSLPSF